MLKKESVEQLRLAVGLARVCVYFGKGGFRPPLFFLNLQLAAEAQSVQPGVRPWRRPLCPAMVLLIFFHPSSPREWRVLKHSTSRLMPSPPPAPVIPSPGCATSCLTRMTANPSSLRFSIPPPLLGKFVSFFFYWVFCHHLKLINNEISPFFHQVKQPCKQDKPRTFLSATKWNNYCVLSAVKSVTNRNSSWQINTIVLFCFLIFGHVELCVLSHSFKRGRKGYVSLVALSKNSMISFILVLKITKTKKQKNKCCLTYRMCVWNMQIGSNPTSKPTRLQKDQTALHNHPEMRRELMKQTRLNRQ